MAMHTKTEYLIWDKIVNSAKRRIDINDYGEKATKISTEILDKLILHIIAAFASGEGHSTISTNLHNELHHIGMDVNEDVIDKIRSEERRVGKGCRLPRARR